MQKLQFLILFSGFISRTLPYSTSSILASGNKHRFTRFSNNRSAVKFRTVLEICSNLDKSADADELFSEPPALMTSHSGRKTIGVDYGLKRTGVCVSVGYAPRALPVIFHNNQPDLVAQALVDLVKREAAEQMVVGFPINSRGLEGEQANCTRTMVAELASRAPLCTIYLWDERHRSPQGVFDFNRSKILTRRVLQLSGGA
jgi:RNase H-fold protein (predicted Holliday junction resolvase)